jgi:hypothetical protein
MALDKLDLFEAHWISGPRHICLQAFIDQMILCWSFCGMGLDKLDLFEAQNHEKPRHICLQSFSDQMNILCNQFLVKKERPREISFSFICSSQEKSSFFLYLVHLFFII